QGVRELRLRSAGRSDGERAGGSGYGLIAINSSGNTGDFNLRPGRGLPGDLPLLRLPAAVHMVHSWSAHSPGHRPSVAGRFLSNGAYAYIGSVSEPFLHAFQPTPVVAARLVSSAPWGVVGRHDGGSPWKVAVFGDPLMTMGPAEHRAEGAVPLEGATPLRPLLAGALKALDFADAARMLSMLGDDANAARLAAVLAREDGAGLRAAAASLAMSSFFAGDTGAFVPAATAALDDPAQAAAHPMIKDAAWHVLWPNVRTLRRPELELLRRCVRADQVARDTGELGAAIEMAEGAGAGRAFIQQSRAGVGDEQSRALMDEAFEQTLMGK
ncbi:MAG: hypothetical protein H7Y88_06240, partial [Phycisphaerales bacterium]|nr:hypothetical protein [Phycisphaerales bacterium]